MDFTSPGEPLRKPMAGTSGNRNVGPKVAVVLAVFPVAAIALAFVSLGGADSPNQLPPKSNFSLEHARAVSDRPVYYAGDRVDGLPLVAVLRRNDTADFMSFVYGDCLVSGPTGCAPPVEVQVWHACKRHFGLYNQPIPGTPIPEAPIPELKTVRGVPAAVFEDGLRLEIHTGKSLIVIFADSRERTEQVANALEGLNVGISKGAQLTKPAAGAVEGKLPCLN
jgi:hypothetical protein